jgi:hypothetical protein
MTLGSFLVFIQRHHVDRAHGFEATLQAAAGFVFCRERFVFKARDVLSRAELARFDTEVADAGGFEVFQLGGKLGSLRGMRAPVFAQGVGFGTKRLELLLAFKQRDAQQASLFGPSCGFRQRLLAQIGELLPLGGEGGILLRALLLLGCCCGELLFKLHDAAAEIGVHAIYAREGCFRAALSLFEAGQLGDGLRGCLLRGFAGFAVTGKC